MRYRIASLASLLILMGSRADAQTLRDKVEDLFRFGGGCPDPVCLSVDAGIHGEHFNPAAREGETNLIVFLTDAIGVSASSVPISSASSGSVWGRSPEGFPVRTRISAGPIFAERARTLGKGRVLVGSNASSFNFSTLRGVPLTGLQETFTHQDVGQPGLGVPGLENDVIEVNTSIDLNLIAITPFVTYGLTDGVDVSMAVPLVISSLDGSSIAQIIPTDPAIPHFFGDSANKQLRSTAAASGSATGIGDVALRVKARLLNTPRMGVAVLADARLATGNADNFLGAGTTTFRGLGILALSYGAFSPHLNAGYNFRGSEHNSAILATVGFDQLISSVVTLAVDFLSEWQVGDSKLDFPEPLIINTTVGTGSSVRVVYPTNLPNNRDDVVQASIGAKFTTSGGVTTTTNLLIPVVRGGLQPEFAWTLGVEYMF